CAYYYGSGYWYFDVW
nr:immunoglobulin heavy chain junction region [Mus musculus]